MNSNAACRITPGIPIHTTDGQEEELQRSSESESESQVIGLANPESFRSTGVPRVPEAEIVESSRVPRPQKKSLHDVESSHEHRAKLTSRLKHKENAFVRFYNAPKTATTTTTKKAPRHRHSQQSVSHRLASPSRCVLILRGAIVNRTKYC